MMQKLIFLATEDWFVASHFLPLLGRAREEGYEIAIAARDSGALKAEGVRVIAMPFARGALSPRAVMREAAAVRDLLKTERPAIVHAIALRSIVAALLAGRGGAKRALAVTGRGYLSVAASGSMRLADPVLARWIRRAVRDGDTLLVENAADRAWVEAGAPLPDARVTLMPGAGVDPARFAATPEPKGALVVGVASRLVRSKGVDLAVDAVRQLKARGRVVHLRIAGAADPDNPDAVTADALARWRATPGVSVLGHVENVSAFWSETHVACFPTRGGEGLPRSLLEAAACARPLIVTDTPGCAEFVRAAGAGLVVPPESAGALAAAIETLAQDAAARQTLAAAARAHVLAHHTEKHAADTAARAWGRLLDA